MMGPEIDVGALSQLSSENLRVVLRKIPGSKDLIIEQKLMKPLDKIAGMNLIKSCGVDKVFKLEAKRPDSVASTKVYLLTPDLEITKKVCNHLNTSVSSNASSTNVDTKNNHSTCHLIFLPKILRQSEIILEEEGLHGKVILHSYMWEAIPLDYNLLSLELPLAFTDLYASGDLSQLSIISQSLSGIQALFGKIPFRRAVGNLSAAALDQLKIIENPTLTSSSNANSGSQFRSRTEIGNLFVFDRNVDYATTLLSPLTYESLLDETFGINCGVVELGKEITKTNNSVKLNLSSKDRIFNKIRHKPMGPDIFTMLSSYAKALQQQQSKASTLNITEMKKFVQTNLKDIQAQSRAIALHISALEEIQKRKGPIYEKVVPIELSLLQGTGYKDALLTLEDFIAQKYPIDCVLKLMCLTSHCNSGIVTSDMERIKSQFLQTYGFERLININRLLGMGLIFTRETLARRTIQAGAQHLQATSHAPSQKTNSIPFQQVVKKLGLSNKSSTQQATDANPGLVDESSPAYVFNGAYLPIACKIVQETLERSKQPSNLTEYYKELETTLGVPCRLLDISGIVSESAMSCDASKTVLIFFIGGYTLAEVAAFRHLQTSLGYHFVICSTCNITGRTLINSILECDNL